MSGDSGNDIYLFNLGSGQDIIYDNDTTVGNVDTVKLGEDKLQFIFAKSGNNLTVSLAGTSDQLAIDLWYSGTKYQTEVFQSSDGSMLLNSQVEQLIHAMSTFCADNSVSWNDAVQDRPQDVQAVLAQYWTPSNF
jgi:hypothetical protein